MARSSLVRSLITLVISACGTGSGLVGIAIAGGGAGGTAPVLSFVAQPNRANTDQILATVQVAAQDSTGAVDTTFSGAVTVALASNPTGAGLSGTTSVRAARGVASFTDLSIDRPGTYTLQASANGASAITSSSFIITAPTGP